MFLAVLSSLLNLTYGDNPGVDSDELSVIESSGCTVVDEYLTGTVCHTWRDLTVSNKVSSLRDTTLTVAFTCECACK